MEVNYRDFRGDGGAMEHRSPGEKPTHRDPVNSAHQFASTPTLDTRLIGSSAGTVTFIPMHASNSRWSLLGLLDGREEDRGTLTGGRSAPGDPCRKTKITLPSTTTKIPQSRGVRRRPGRPV